MADYGPILVFAKAKAVALSSLKELENEYAVPDHFFFGGPLGGVIGLPEFKPPY